MVRSTQVTILSVDDRDGDGVPDSLESKLCGYGAVRNVLIQAGGTAGSCNAGNSSDYIPPSVGPVRLNHVPFRISDYNVDADGDRIPGNVTVSFVNITVYRTSLPPTVVSDGSMSVPIDQNDHDPTIPLKQAVCGPMADTSSLSFDGDYDNDGIPGNATVTLSMACVDRRDPTHPYAQTYSSETIQVDFNDHNASIPAQQFVNVSLPRSIQFDGRDDDHDHVLKAYNLTWLDISFNRMDPANPTFGSHTTTSAFDFDDNNPNNPVPLTSVDGDGDLIPDAAEVAICTQGLQNDNTELDGSCSGTDYRPPSWYQAFLPPLPTGAGF